VGGGGGNSGSSITVSTEQGFMSNTSQIVVSTESSIGGQGGSGGDGGTVSVDNSNTIWITGSFSSGIFAQSVGGGGGTGTTSLNVSADLNSPQNMADLSHSVNMSLSIGGQAGSGDGGDVTVTNSGDIVTEDVFSSGIVAQSVGGGGGLGSYIAAMEVTVAGNQIPDIENILESGSLDIELKGNNGSSGNGGDVTVTNSGNIVTEDVFSSGIVAQSVGGGGGLAGVSNELGVTTTSFGSNMQGVLINTEGLGLSFAGSVGGNGSGGSVTVNNSGNIITQGDYSHGIFAQSAGGTGSGGSITVTNSGNILAEGANSDGILAQSVGGTGGGNVSVTIHSGKVQGGSGTGAAVRIMEGSTNTVTSHGIIVSKDGVAGNAIIGTSGNETVDNYGTVIGSVDLGVGSNAFNNKVAATFNSGAIVNLGTGNNMLTNAGTLSPGGSTTPLTTVLNGNVVQMNSGTFEVEVYKDGEHDKLHVNGDSASLDGTLTVTRGRGPYKNGTTYDIIEVTGSQGISGSFSDILLPDSKPLLRFDVNQLPNSVEVEVYAPKSTTVAKNRAHWAIANYLDRVMPLANGDLSYVLGEIQNLSEPEEFNTAFSSLSPGSYDNYTRGTVFTAQQYAKSLQYRMNNVRSHIRAGSPNSEKPILVAYSGSDASQLFTLGELSQVQGKSGLWLDAFGQWGDQDEEDGYTGYDYFLRGATLGFDHRLLDKLMVGLSLGYSRSDIDLDRDQGDGDVKSLFGSLYGSYFDKNLYIDAILSYGRNWYDNSRLIRVGGILREATSEHDAHLFSGYLGGGYYFDFNPWAFGPYGSLQYIRLDEESFTEKGAGGVSLRVDDRQTDALVSELGLRMVGHFKGKYGNFLPEVSLGWGHDFDIDDHVVRASFAGSPGSSFSIEGQDVERNGLVAGAGLTFIHKSGISTSFRYKGDFRGDYKSNAIMGELRFSF
jgi:uncharacterized protein with beta-barrel porin domain